MVTYYLTVTQESFLGGFLVIDHNNFFVFGKLSPFLCCKDCEIIR